VTEGQCGRCDGLANVDTLGVMEFDTNTDTFIGGHVMPDGTGGDPFGSPDGRHVVLVGRNGGEVVRILAAGAAGEKSTVAFDLELGFSTFEEEESAVFNDFAFIQTTKEVEGVDRDMIIIASGTENKVALVDVISGTPQVTIVTMRDNSDMSARRNRRQVEWVAGTPYVWIDGTGSEEVYVLDIDAKKMVKTITGQTTTKMISVENFAAKRTADLISQQIKAAIADLDARPSSPSSDSSSSSESKDTVNKSSESASDDKDDKGDLNMANMIDQLTYKDDNDIDPIGIAALVVGLMALVVGVANMIYMSRSKAAEGGNSGDSVGDSVDQKTLGSKNIA